MVLARLARLAKPKQNLGRFNVGQASPRLLFNASLASLLSRDDPINYSSKFDLELDPSQLVNLYDLLVERSSYFSEVQTQLTALRLFPQQRGDLTPDQVLGVWLFLWLQVNFLNGVGEFGFSMVFPYQGMCFPSACSGDISRLCSHWSSSCIAALLLVDSLLKYFLNKY